MRTLPLLCLLSLPITALPAVARAEAPDEGSAAKAPPEAKKQLIDASKLPFTEYSIKKVVSVHSADIQKCYEGVIADLGKSPPQGRVVVSFAITPEGTTKDVKVVKDPKAKSKPKPKPKPVAKGKDGKD